MGVPLRRVEKRCRMVLSVGRQWVFEPRRSDTPMSSVTGSRSVRDSMGTLSWGGVALAVALGIIYLFLGAGMLSSPFGISFVLAGLGYLGAVGLVVAGIRRRLVYGVGIAYNVLLIVLYFVLTSPSVSDLASLDGVTKLLQVVFAVLLVVVLTRGR
jgi:hypothetical protein